MSECVSGSLRDDLDLNLVQRHSSLSSSAAIHRLAVRPKGKRGLSTYQQKLNATSLVSSSVSALAKLVRHFLLLCNVLLCLWYF